MWHFLSCHQTDLDVIVNVLPWFPMTFVGEGETIAGMKLRYVYLLNITINLSLTTEEEKKTFISFFHFNFNTFTPSPLIPSVFSFLNERPVHHFRAIVHKQIQCLLTRTTSQRILMTMMIQFPLKINIQFIYFIFYSYTHPHPSYNSKWCVIHCIHRKQKC